MGFNENTSATVAESMDVARAAPLPSGHKVPLPIGRVAARLAAAIPPQGLAWGGLHFSECPQHSGASLALNAKDS